MKENRNDNKKDADVLGTLSHAFHDEVSEELETRLKGRLDAFRQDLREHPHARRQQFGKSSSRHKADKNTRSFRRPLLLAGPAIALVVFVVFPFGKNTPTWAEVTDSFRRAGSYHATFYLKNCGWCTTSQIEFWKGYGEWFRILSGHTVAFGNKYDYLKDGHLKAFNLKERAEANPDPAIQAILLSIGPIDETKIDFVQAILEAHSDGEIIDTTAMVNPDPVFSKDLVVFDSTHSGGISIRLWALRESRLPVRVLYRGLAGYSADVIITYSKEQPEKFFDPEAFAAEMKKSYYLADDLMYLFMEDPAESLKSDIPQLKSEP